MKKEIKREIRLDSREQRQTIANVLGVTMQALGQYLRFERNSEKAIMARAMALNSGGKLMQEVDREDVVKILNAKGEIEKVVTNF